jgi:membrane protein implicated in regulation of membrane protease activity
MLDKDFNIAEHFDGHREGMRGAPPPGFYHHPSRHQGYAAGALLRPPPPSDDRHIDTSGEIPALVLVGLLILLADLMVVLVGFCCEFMLRSAATFWDLPLLPRALCAVGIIVGYATLMWLVVLIGIKWTEHRATKTTGKRSHQDHQVLEGHPAISERFVANDDRAPMPSAGARWRFNSTGLRR